jgi:hypothetical protein
MILTSVLHLSVQLKQRDENADVDGFVVGLFVVVRNDSNNL